MDSVVSFLTSNFAVTLITIIVSGIIGYYLGKRKQILDIKINKGFEKAEDISRFINTIEENINSLIITYKLNYKTEKYDLRALENYENRMDTIFESEKVKFSEYQDSIVSLNDLRKVIGVYTSENLADNIKNYLDCLTFEHSDLGGPGGYFFKFFEHFLHKNNDAKRIAAFNKVVKELYSLNF